MIIKILPKGISNFIFSIKHRKTWQTDNQSYLEYNEKYLDRKPLIDELQKLMKSKNCHRPKILEFGCSGANNLRLIKNIFPNYNYCGIDINETAINFARQQFPDDTFHVCNEDQFKKLISQLGHQDVLLAFAVLYYIKPSKVQEILTIASDFVDYIFVCDDLTCFNFPAGQNDGLFLHSFSALCREARLEIIVGPVYSEDPENRHGYFIAQSRNKQRSRVNMN